MQLEGQGDLHKLQQSSLVKLAIAGYEACNGNMKTLPLQSLKGKCAYATGFDRLGWIS